MRLTDLNPKWVGLNGRPWLQDWVARTGIRFDCPHCGERVIVWFKPFIDPDNGYEKVKWAFPDAPNPNTGEETKTLFHNRTGDSFENISFTPSVDIKGHWHGHITNGELIPS